MKTYIVTINHGALASKQNERTLFVIADSEQTAYRICKKQLLDFGIDGFEYIVSVERIKQ